EHVRVQAAIHKWVDSAISKTANAPSTYTVEDTRKLYELAYSLGVKGCTIYVDKSRNEQVLNLIEDEGENKEAEQPGSQLEQADRSEEHTSELQSREKLVCRLLLEKKKKIKITDITIT